jgi:TLC domain
MTGGTVQLINGIFLLITFFSCRLIYGTYASVQAATDVFKALHLARRAPHDPPLAASAFALNATAQVFASPVAALQVVQYAPPTPAVPTWLWASFAAANVTLNALNWFWFEKMIGTIRKRFDPPLGTRTAAAGGGGAVGGGDGATEAVMVDVDVTRGGDGSGRKTIEVDEVEVRRRVPNALVEDDMPPPA